MTIAAASKREESSPVARHIARAAARLFAERGYDATSVREIVEAAGGAKPTLYYYFRSKEGLAQALITVPLSNLTATLQRIVSQGENPLTRPEQGVDAPYNFCREDPDRGRFIYALLFGPLGSEVASELEPFKESLSGWTDAAVRRLAEVQIVPRHRAEACSTACRGLIIISTLDYLYRDKPLGRDLARQNVNDLLRGFGDSRYTKELES